MKANRPNGLADRQRALAKPGDIGVQLIHVPSRALLPTRVEASFEQVYRSSIYSDTTIKTLTWTLQDGAWLIVSESKR